MKIRNDEIQNIKKFREIKRPRIGIYTMGLKAYWSQFENLKERLLGYGRFISNKVKILHAEIFYYGIVDCEEAGRKCGEYFNKNNVDLVLAHSGTYVTSASVIPLHKICKVPVILLNLQPTARVNYEKTTTGEWLAHCGACPIPELTNAFNRSGITCHIVNGLLGQGNTPSISLTDENTADSPQAIKAWKEIEEWIYAAMVKRELFESNFGFLGGYYSGMLDMYSDITMLQAQTGIHVKILEMCDLNKQLEKVTENEIKLKMQEINNIFIINEKQAADPMARKPAKEQLRWSAQVAAAQERLVQEYGLDALSYYYHGSPESEYEKLQSGFIVGHSLLTAKGIPCAGEGDIKTCLAMKICDILGKGGSFCEIVTVDYIDGTILLGHDGPFHLAISKGKPILRGMGIYHGKQGSGVSVEAKVRAGNITNLGCTQTFEGKLKLIITEAKSTDGPIMTIGNTQTHVKFKSDPDSFMDSWFRECPTHHFAMSIGHNASLYQKVAELLQINSVLVN